MKPYLLLCSVLIPRLYSRGKVLCEVRVLTEERFFLQLRQTCAPYMVETKAKDEAEVV